MQRNKGIDGFLNFYIDGLPVPIKIQEKGQTISEAIASIMASKKAKKSAVKIIVKTNDIAESNLVIPEDIILIESIDYQMDKLSLKKNRVDR